VGWTAGELGFSLLGAGRSKGFSFRLNSRPTLVTTQHLFGGYEGSFSGYKAAEA